MNVVLHGLTNADIGIYSGLSIAKACMHSHFRSAQAIRLRDTEGSALEGEPFACRSN